jgi:hypothetical protein
MTPSRKDCYLRGIFGCRKKIEIVYDCECKLLELREDKWTGDAN